MNINMKFFDYKFIILLALTLIIYFIYREVDSLNERITKLENSLKQEETKQIKHEVPQEVHHVVSQDVDVQVQTIYPEITSIEPLPEYNSNIILSKDSFAPKNISIDLLPTNNNTLYSVVSSDSESDSDYEDEDETTYSTSHASKHLAIYSNDNEQTEDTHHSLLESVKLNNKLESFDFNYNDIIKEDLSENIDLNCNSESSEHVELTIVNNKTIESDSESSEVEIKHVNINSESSEVEAKQDNLDSSSSEVEVKQDKLESSSSVVEAKQDNIDSVISDVERSESVKKVLEPSESPKNNVIEESESSSSDINIVVKTSGNDSKRKYDRMKLQELQNVAQTMEINLVKKIKGIDKQKTKNELIKEILKKNI